MTDGSPADWPRVVGDTALIVPVPVAEELVSTWRLRHDPAAADGVPAHVTLLYPFVPLADLESSLPVLDALFAAADPIEVIFSAVEQFPSVTYLAPEPASWFKGLTMALVDAFPACPPYGGQFSLEDVIPHLTVADIRDDTDHAQLHERFTAEARKVLPLRQPVTSVDLIAAGESGRWSTHTTFAIGHGRLG